MENENRSNKDIWERLVRLETRAEIIYNDLKDIRGNDLNHLEKKIDKNLARVESIERKLAMAAGALAVLQILMPVVYHVLFN